MLSTKTQDISLSKKERVPRHEFCPVVFAMLLHLTQLQSYASQLCIYPAVHEDLVSLYLIWLTQCRGKP